jgi:hypothetical protein
MPAYNEVTLRAALSAVGTGKGWAWQAKPGVGNPALTDKYRYYERNKDFMTELFDYCWCVYDKALHAGGDQLIGRSDDLKPLKQKIANIDVAKGQTLLQHATQGNILEMDKWGPTVNDCWVLGGVHRRANFQLVSPRSFQNLWDASRNGLVVTAREILGLQLFGYERETTPGGAVTFVSKSPVKALTASLELYDRELVQRERQGPGAATGLMGLRDDVAAQIKSFDKSKLRRVAPPRT